MLLDRGRGCAVGAAIGDALGMPLEFKGRRPTHALVRDMAGGRLPPGHFTDDTEMALALAESLLAHRPLNLADLAQRFVRWMQSEPRDIGSHTRRVLTRIANGDSWHKAVEAEQEAHPDSAGNGSLMRCWPVVLADWNHPDALITDSARQSQVTHPHPDCVSACALVNLMIYHLLSGSPPESALSVALESVSLSDSFRNMIKAAPHQDRERLLNSGWVRHTVESAVWGLITTSSFEEAVIQVVNLGNDADTAGTVAGALAGACYGLGAIPVRWKDTLRGEWPLGSGTIWSVDDLVWLADRLISPETTTS